MTGKLDLPNQLELERTSKCANQRECVDGGAASLTNDVACPELAPLGEPIIMIIIDGQDDYGLSHIVILCYVVYGKPGHFSLSPQGADWPSPVLPLYSV